MLVVLSLVSRSNAQEVLRDDKGREGMKAAVAAALWEEQRERLEHMFAVKEARAEAMVVAARAVEAAGTEEVDRSTAVTAAPMEEATQEQPEDAQLAGRRMLAQNPDTQLGQETGPGRLHEAALQSDAKEVKTSTGTRSDRAPPREAQAAVGFSLGVMVLASLIIFKERLIALFSGEARVEEPEARHKRRRGRARGQGRGQDQGRGRSQGQSQKRAAEPEDPTSAPQDHTAARTPVDEPDWWLELEEFHEDLDAAAREERPDFLCPVTSEIMRVPYLLVDGHESLHTYEYNVLVSWFITERNDTDPVRNTRIDPARRNFISDGRLRREIRNWCESKAREWRQELESHSAPAGRAVARTNVHVFVDHSNAAIGARKAGRQLQLDLAWLAQRVEAGRQVKERVVVGSHESGCCRAEWEQLGYTVAADPRRGREHFVDEALHAQLMRAAAKRFDPARVIALVTGDGNANEGRTSFPQCIDEALKNDWYVELHSWRRSTNQVYARYAEQYPEQFAIRYLD